MSSDNDTPSPGTAAPARVRKAACGIRFDDDELQEGIDFSAADQLKPKSPPDDANPPPAASDNDKR